ncbi:hypothetical protein HanPI659440_Chr04g0148261 [Helianthus annuus]|nr:hypothetical protein HanPI659440_Chr04g0148261 [Helianthus annuus]
MIFLNQWKYQLIHPSHLHPSAFCFGFRRARSMKDGRVCHVNVGKTRCKY